MRLVSLNRLDGKYHMLDTGELYMSGVDKSDQYNHFRCRTQHRFQAVHQISSNSVSVSVTGEQRFII